MRLEPDLGDWMKVAFLVFGVPLLAWRTFQALGTYDAWRSPWKRMLVVAPLLIVAVFSIVMFLIVINE